MSEQKKEEKQAIADSASPAELAAARKRIAELEAAESQHRAVERALQERTHELGERVKELNCLYGMSHLREKPGVSLEEILQGTVELIPPSWQYPEITCARIVLDGQEFSTENFEEGAAWRQAADIFVHGRRRGTVEVGYADERPESDEGPFLQEERNLINAIAEQVGRITEHKRTEQEYTTILKAAIDGFWICDTAGRILDVNDSLCQMLGYSRQELLATAIPEIEAVETPEEVARHISVVVEKGYDRFESRLRRRDGTLIDIEASVSYAEAGGGWFSAFIRDISERKRAEEALQGAHDELELRVQERTTELAQANEALRNSEEMWRSLVENAPVRVTTVGPDGTILFVNRTAPGRSAPEVLGSSIYQYLPPKERKKARQALRSVFGTGKTEVYEATIVRADGTKVIYENHVAPIMSNGQVATAIFISMDVTARVRTEEALRESEALYRAMFERNRAVKVLIDPRTGAIVDANPAAVEFYGYRLEELKAMTMMDINILPPEQVRAKMGQAESDERHYFLCPHRLASGEVRNVEVHSSPIDVGGQRLLYSIVHDISERVEAEQEIERAHQRESVLNALLRISMEDTPLETQLDRALDEILSIPWLPVLRQGAIFLTGQDPRVLELVKHRGFDPVHQRVCARVDFGQCLCGQAAASGQSLFSDRVDARHEIGYEGMGPHGHYCVPILSGGKAIGTIVLYMEEGRGHDAHQEEFLQAVAHTLAGIIERKRVLEALRESEQQLRAVNEQLEDYGRNLEQKVAARTREIEQRRHVAESLRDILTVLNSNRPVDEILDHIVAEASRLLGSDASAIYRLAEADGAFSIQTIQGMSAELAAGLDVPPGLSQALQAGQPVAVFDGKPAFPDDPPLVPLQVASPEKRPDSYPALLAVPLTVASEAYGGLVLYYLEPREFSDEEIRLAVAFADQAALAIENARLASAAGEAAVLEERGRLARELHDSVTQSLYSLTLLAEGWRRLSKAGRLEDTDDPLTELGEIAQQALKEMRLMVYELRPPDLEEEGLLGALHQRLGAVEKRAGVESRLVAEDIVDLPAPVEEGLYRIAIEALNNALKHSAATVVTVHLRATDERVELEVEDNGHGFDLGSIDASQGIGLGSMRERAEKLGGILTIHSAPGQGTKVRVGMEIDGSS